MEYKLRITTNIGIIYKYIEWSNRWLTWIWSIGWFLFSDIIKRWFDMIINFHAIVWTSVHVNKNSPIDTANPSVYISVFSIVSSSTYIYVIILLVYIYIHNNMMNLMKWVGIPILWVFLINVTFLQLHLKVLIVFI